MDFEIPYLRPVDRSGAFPGSKYKASGLNNSSPRFNDRSVFTSPERPKPEFKSSLSHKNLTQFDRIHNRSPQKAADPAQNDTVDTFSALAAKKLRLEQLKKEMATVEFEIIELETKIKFEAKDSPKDSSNDPSNDSTNDFFFPTGKSLSRKVSKLFMAGSTILAPTPPQHTLTSPKKVGESFGTLHRKASNYFNNRLLPDVKEKFDQQQTELEAFSKKGADIAKNLISTLSPKKKAVEIGPETSFSLDHLGDLSLVDTSVILSEDSVIDIDDYESD